jgi:hypothetical protein
MNFNRLHLMGLNLINWNMKKLYYLAVFYTTLSFSQTAKEFLINDNDKLYHSSLTEVIAESKNYGYNLQRDDKGNYILGDGLDQYFALFKKIESANDEGFPYSSIGSIWKKYSFAGKEGKENIWKIETEMYLTQYPNESSSEIKNCYKKIKNDIVKNNIKNNYTASQSSNKLNYKSILGHNYDIIEESILIKPLPIKDSKEIYYSENIYTNGEYLESEKGNNYNYLTFSFTEKGMSEFNEKMIEFLTSSQKSNENIRFTIGNQDIRKINQYDLEAMVKFFLEDCKKSNIKVPEIKTLNATFEPLEGDVIALSYAFGDDSLIKIKVDPEKWAKSNMEKRWYVLYHELGHDILNLEHGQGGKMMFNFADKEYTWDDFFQDKQYMLNFKINK